MVSGPEVEEIANFFSYVCAGDNVYNMELEARLGKYVSPSSLTFFFGYLTKESPLLGVTPQAGASHGI